MKASERMRGMQAKVAINEKQSALLKELSLRWGPFMEAIGGPMKPREPGELPEAPWGWRAKDPEAVGAALKEALLDQLREGTLATAGADERDRDGMSVFWAAESRTEALCVWAVSQAARAGAFEPALEAMEAAHQSAFSLEDQAVARALLTEALETRGRETPSAVEARINRLGAAEALWSGESAWAKGAERARDRWAGAFRRHHEERLGLLAAELVKAAELRPGCAESAARVIRGLTENREVAWGAAGEKAGESIGRLKIKAERVPEALFSGLPIEFWLGVKSQLSGASALGAEIFRRALVAGKEDEWARDQACLLAWSGLDRREIGAFEAAFPGGARACLKRALGDPDGPDDEGFRGGYALTMMLDLRMAAAAARPEGKWARAALADESGEIKGSLGSPSFEKSMRALDGLMALREADLLRQEVKAAKAERMSAAAAAGEPAAKKAKRSGPKSL